MSKSRALLPILTLAALFSSCGAPKDAKGTASNESQAGPQPGLFTVSREQLPHLLIVPVQTSNWSIAIHNTSTVDWDVDNTTHAITQVNGPISRILVDTGTHVKAGEPLLYVSSPDVANAISTYRKARNQEE